MCKDALGTTDFVLSDGTIIFRTHPQEKNKLIFQIVSTGTCVLVDCTMNIITLLIKLLTIKCSIIVENAILYDHAHVLSGNC